MLASIQKNTLDFELPKQQNQSLPTEIRGMARDEVKLMVSKLLTDSFFHSRFNQIGRFLRAGDVLLINTSATLPAALDIVLPTGHLGRLHLSNHLQDKTWLGELRQLIKGIPKRFALGQSGDVIRLPGGRQAHLMKPFYQLKGKSDHLHLWEIEIDIPENPFSYLKKYGQPIRYHDQQYPMEYYQTAFASEPGSAEMPSAGRAFTPALVTQLMMSGIQFAPLLLHTGISSLEAGESPYPEYFRIPPATAGLVRQAQREGRRIIAVGTTAVRAIESAVDEKGKIQAVEGWTERHITPENGLKVVNGLLTGFHEPSASHLQMLEALSGRRHLELAYDAAVKNGYQWHEFGDLHLIV